jgi:hypothetical protein
MITTYNKKKFLLPESPRSMASMHGKVMEDSVMKLTIHDCKGSIQLWNDLKDPEQIKEAIDKLSELEKGASELRKHIEKHYLE